jgi:hypothetical protein
LGSNADLGHSSASAPHDTPVIVEPVTPWKWLASDESRYITRVMLPIDAGVLVK